MRGDTMPDPWHDALEMVCAGGVWQLPPVQGAADDAVERALLDVPDDCPDSSGCQMFDAGWHVFGMR